jgi:hypothetical protein
MRLERKLLRSRFRFQNCTEPTKYEGSQRNVRSKRQNAVASAISSTVMGVEGLSWLGFWEMID